MIISAITKFVTLVICTLFVNAQELNNLDSDIDNLALNLEGQRLNYIYHQKSGYPVFFFNEVFSQMNQDPQLKFSDFEKSFRKFNTGLNLIAIPVEADKENLKEKNLCVAPLDEEDQKTPDFYIYLESGDPAQTPEILKLYGVESIQENLKNMDEAGRLIYCPPSS